MNENILSATQQRTLLELVTAWAISEKLLFPDQTLSIEIKRSPRSPQIEMMLSESRVSSENLDILFSYDLRELPTILSLTMAIRFKARGVFTAGQLCRLSLSEASRVRQVGNGRRLKEIRQSLMSRGLDFEMTNVAGPLEEAAVEKFSLDNFLVEFPTSTRFWRDARPISAETRQLFTSAGLETLGTFRRRSEKEIKTFLTTIKSELGLLTLQHDDHVTVSTLSRVFKSFGITWPTS